jgi:hypothetical protein
MLLTVPTDHPRDGSKEDVEIANLQIIPEDGVREMLRWLTFRSFLKMVSGRC